MQIMSGAQPNSFISALLSTKVRQSVDISYFLEAHDNNNLLKENQFTVSRKCQFKFDRLVFEMLFIKNLKPNLNFQTDPIRAKLFV